MFQNMLLSLWLLADNDHEMVSSSCGETCVNCHNFSLPEPKAHISYCNDSLFVYCKFLFYFELKLSPLNMFYINKLYE